MNAAVIAAPGEPPRYATFEDPVPASSDCLVRVRAAGLHRVVRSITSGKHYLRGEGVPFVPGVDGVGTLDDGSRVLFGATRPPFGSFAERSITMRDLCVPVPPEIDDVTAAGMSNPAMSSWGALTVRAGFVAGESVLVLGATGTAGALAVQIAKRLGARSVVAAGRNPVALEALASLGADAAISLTQERAALVNAFRAAIRDHEIDVVLDYLWGEPAESVLEAFAGNTTSAAKRVRYVQIGAVAGEAIALRSATLRSSGLEILGSGFGSVSLARLMESIGRFFEEAAKLPFSIETRTVALRDVERAWSAVDGRARTVFVP